MAVLSVAPRGRQCDPWSLDSPRKVHTETKPEGLGIFGPLCCYKFIIFRESIL